MFKTYEKSAESHAILDEESRRKKARKILSVIKEETDLEHCHLLEVGTGAGIMSEVFSNVVKKVASIDVVDERTTKKGFDFKIVNDENIPYQDSSYDVVISNHVVEHVKDQEKHLKELVRVVKDGGFIYIATPNKYWPIDPHYRLPFISFLPRNLAASLIRLTKRGMQWDVYPVSRSMLNKNLSSHKKQYLIPQFLKYPSRYELDLWSGITFFSKMLPISILRLFAHLSPTLILLVKVKK